MTHGNFFPTFPPLIAPSPYLFGTGDDLVRLRKCRSDLMSVRLSTTVPAFPDDMPEAAPYPEMPAAEEVPRRGKTNVPDDRGGWQGLRSRPEQPGSGRCGKMRKRDAGTDSDTPFPLRQTDGASIRRRRYVSGFRPHVCCPPRIAAPDTPLRNPADSATPYGTYRGDAPPRR